MWPAGNRVLAPAFQVVRRPVVQMVGSRHSSLSQPSTTVTATVAPPWPWAGVASPAGQPTSHASTSGVMRSGTDQGRSVGAGVGGGVGITAGAAVGVMDEGKAGAVDEGRTGAVDGVMEGVGPGVVDDRETSPRRSVTLPARGPASAGVGSFAGPVGSFASGMGSYPSRVDPLASRVVSSTSSASGQAGAGAAGQRAVSRGRMRTSFVVGPGGWRPRGSA
jgi:hypothetical protein